MTEVVRKNEYARLEMELLSTIECRVLTHKDHVFDNSLRVSWGVKRKITESTRTSCGCRRIRFMLRSMETGVPSFPYVPRTAG